MISGNTCYFCISPFQLYPIISLALSRKERADLYIDPQFKDACKISDQIQKTGIFENIVIIDREQIFKEFFSKRKYSNYRIQVARNYLIIDKIVAKILKKDIVYSNIYVSSNSILPRLVILYYIKKGYNINVNYFEDGIGSYIKDFAYNINKGDKFVRKILFGEKALKTDYDRYLFAPEVYKRLNPGNNVQLYKIEVDWHNKTWKEMFNYIFEYKDVYNIKEKVIILDEEFNKSLSSNEMYSIEEIYNLFNRSFGIDNTIIKKHPRNTRPDLTGFHYYENYQVPFETLCMNKEMQDIVLVSIGSTAAVTPKLLLEEEPYVIMLYKILEGKRISKDFDQFFLYIKNYYSDSERFLIPENFEELEESIHIIKNKIK